MMPTVAAPYAGTNLGRFNPVAKLAAAAIVMVGLLVTADVVSASIVLGAELVALPLAGVSVRSLARRAWPLPVAAAGVAVANIVASDTSGSRIAGVSLRLIAIALPGVLAFASTDAVDLADSLVQQLHVPSRVAYGALAGLRLLPLLASDWDVIHRARRARGIDAGRSPVGAIRLFASAVYALLVGAIRRATRLALAMDSRGFDSREPRTSARRQHVGAGDWVLVLAVVAVVAAANVVAVVAGTWHPLFL
jgi:energy-coupling factor transport system permease protein